MEASMPCFLPSLFFGCTPETLLRDGYAMEGISDSN
jgi:hypothetical protein